MSKNAVARRYALALLNLLEPSEVDTVQRGLHALSEALEHTPLLKHVLTAPVFTQDEKLEVLRICSRRAGCPAIVEDFLKQVLRKNRIGFLPEIATQFRTLTDQRQGRQPISLETARDLDETLLQQWRTQLQAVLRREVELTCITNPSLLAGVRLKIGSKVYDSSVRGQLEHMSMLLAKG
ncbi:MAG: ATP synthase F1 subunit delta [Nitrospirae bacterium]|nr:MAG: ATP synthase F1 subunit delta [Nitrospirota bacterium]